MKTLELRDKTNEELQTLLLEELRSQFNLRMRKGTGQLDKPSEIKKTRRNIVDLVDCFQAKNLYNVLMEYKNF